MVAGWRLTEASHVLTFSTWSVIGTRFNCHSRCCCWYCCGINSTRFIFTSFSAVCGTVELTLLYFKRILWLSYHYRRCNKRSSLTFAAFYCNQIEGDKCACVRAYHFRNYNGCSTLLTAFQVVDAEHIVAL